METYQLLEISRRMTVWIEINDHLPWKPGVIVNICPNQSFDVKVEDKVYHRNTHHFNKKVP